MISYPYRNYQKTHPLYPWSVIPVTEEQITTTWTLCDNPTYKRKVHYHAARTGRRWK